MKIKELMKPVIVLCLICLLTTAALAGTNALTKDIIAENSLQAEIESRQKVFPAAADFRENGEYVEGVSADGAVIGYVFVTEISGYGGPVKVMTGIDASGMVTGVSVLEHSETVGLGANVEKTEFVDQFKAAVPQSGFKVVKSTPSSDNEISAVTGATISSKAVSDAVNQAIELYQSVKGGA